jgi:SNF2 family DNA or RNA helicase
MINAWGIDRETGRISVVQGGNQKSYPTAAEIYSAIFVRSTDLQKQTCREIRDAFPGLAFKPEVSFPVFRIRSDASGLIALVVGLHNSELTLTELPKFDQIIHDDVWYPLDLDSFVEAKLELSRKGVSIGTRLTASQCAWLTSTTHLEVKVEIETEKFRANLLDGEEKAFDESTLVVPLYSYQKSGAAFLEAMIENGKSVLLADEMGLGKTIQAIYAITTNIHKGRTKNLVVLPASNLANWLREFEKFSPDTRVAVHSGPSRAGAVASLDLRDVLLTTYDIVNRDQSFLADISWDLIVVDEAQGIKNGNSKRSFAVCSLEKKSAVAITGTPVENSLSDVWGIFEFLDPSFFRSQEEFHRQFPDTHASAVELSNMISPFVVRRRLREVAQDLPERSDFPVPIFLSESMNARYEEIRTDEDLGPLTKMQALRQFCSVTREYKDSSHKLEKLLSLVDDAFSNSGKAIVFASFTETIDLIVNAIRYRHPLAFIASLDGRTDPAERQRTIDAFGASSGNAILIANPRAAGVGLNIQAANYVFHFNPEWNPALISQASARAHRVGQEKHVFIYYLYYRGTVEDYVMEKLRQKTELQDGALSGLEEEPSSSQVLEALKLSPNTLREETGQWN